MKPWVELKPSRSMYICCWHLRSVMDLLPYGSSGTTPCLLYNLEEFSSYRVWFMVRSKTNFHVIRKSERPACSHQAELYLERFWWWNFPPKNFMKRLWLYIGMHDFIPQIVQHLGEYPNVFLHGAGAYPWPDPFYTAFSHPNLKSRTEPGIELHFNFIFTQ